MNNREAHSTLMFLRGQEGFVSGEDISRHLGVSRSAVWKQINQLRQEGYNIEAIPHLGYRLAAVPDKLLPEEIKYRLRTKIIGRSIFYYPAITSTMDAAFALGIKGQPEGAVVFAEGQSRGRGRMKRAWFSPRKKGIYASLLLRPGISLQQAPQITLMAAIGIVQAIKNISGITPRIKWPNDLLIRENKAAGILTEISAEADRIKFVNIGWGINTHINRSALPAGATSLHLETDRKISRLDLACEVLQCLEDNYFILRQKGFGPIKRRWKELTLSLGRRIKIAVSSRRIHGYAQDIDDTGALLIRKDSGILERVFSGDIV